MSDIFLSYASPDRPKARLLAHTLETRGWTVWWDRHIPAGRSFDEVIGEELERASCVLVLWSAASVKSDWVKEEATEAARRKTLIPVLIEAVTIPLGFRRIQAAALIDWQDAAPHAAIEQLVRDIAALIGAPGHSLAEAPQPTALPASTDDSAVAPRNEAETPLKHAARADHGATTAGHKQKRRNVDIVTKRPATPPAGNPDQSPPQRNIDTVAKDPATRPTGAQSGQSERLLEVFRHYCKNDRENFHVAPNIPTNMLETARESGRVPADENVLALIDLTVFMKHAKDCVLFSDRAIYHHHLGERIAIPYASLPSKLIRFKATSLCVGNSPIVTLGPSINSKTWVKLFNDIKSAVAPEF